MFDVATPTYALRYTHLPPLPISPICVNDVISYCFPFFRRMSSDAFDSLIQARVLWPNSYLSKHSFIHCITLYQKLWSTYSFHSHTHSIRHFFITNDDQLVIFIKYTTRWMMDCTGGCSFISTRQRATISSTQLSFWFLAPVRRTGSSPAIN